MELIVITTLCIGLSILLTPCASLQIQVHSSHQQAHDTQLSLSTLPRKLRLMEEATVNEDGGRDFVSYYKQKGALSGKPLHREPEGMMHGRGGTWQEWVEGTDRSQFFTMDYSHVRRRRPIHNKAVPVGP